MSGIFPTGKPLWSLPRRTSPRRILEKGGIDGPRRDVDVANHRSTDERGLDGGLQASRGKSDKRHERVSFEGRTTSIICCDARAQFLLPTHTLHSQSAAIAPPRPRPLSDHRGGNSDTDRRT